MRTFRNALSFLFAALSVSIAAAQAGGSPNVDRSQLRAPENTIWLSVGNRNFAITLNDSESAKAFVRMLPLTLDMADLHANEKFADLPSALPTNATRPGTIRNGDLMLYGAKTLVVFYLGFESTYSYTRLGRAENATGLSEVLGKGNVRVTFSKAK
jgi:hypothetical protein